MKELSITEIDMVSGGDAATAISLALGFVGSFNALTEFGAGLGAGLYDSMHR